MCLQGARTATGPGSTDLLGFVLLLRNVGFRCGGQDHFGVVPDDLVRFALAAADPQLNDRVGWQISGAVLVPANDPLVDVGDLFGEGVDHLLVVGRRCHMRLVTANVDERTRGHGRDLSQDFLREIIGCGVVGIEGTDTDIACALRIRGELAVLGFGSRLGRVQFRDGMQCGRCVPGHVDFRDDHHAVVPGVLHDFLVVVLAVETGVPWFALVWVCRHGGLAGDIRQVRVFDPGGVVGCGWLVHGDAPALVIGEVDMQAVHLELCGVVDVFLHFINGVKGTRHINAHTTVLVTGVVTDNHTAHSPRSVNRGLGFNPLREKLTQCLNTIQSTGPRVRGNFHAVGVSLQRVAFGLGLGTIWRNREFNIVDTSSTGDHR